MQQCLAGDAGDNMPAAAYGFAAIAGVDGIPDDKLAGDLLIRFVVSALKGGQRAIREYNAPAIGDIRRVALQNGDVVGWIGLLDEQTSIEARRPCAQDDDFHAGSLRLPRPSSTAAS